MVSSHTSNIVQSITLPFQSLEGGRSLRGHSTLDSLNQIVIRQRHGKRYTHVCVCVECNVYGHPKKRQSNKNSFWSWAGCGLRILCRKRRWSVEVDDDSVEKTTCRRNPFTDKRVVVIPLVPGTPVGTEVYFLSEKEDSDRLLSAAQGELQTISVRRPSPRSKTGVFFRSYLWGFGDPNTCVYDFTDALWKGDRWPGAGGLVSDLFSVSEN